MLSTAEYSRRLIYDNLTTAVEKVFKGKERKLQESFERFRAYYNFTPRFCNRGEAHEKGGVEGLVGYARRNFLVPMPRVESLEALNAQLLAECAAYGDHRIAGRDKAVKELFEEERPHLVPLPENPFSNLETASGKVDKYSTVIVEKNRYSAPPRFAGLMTRVVLYVERVEIFYGSQRIAKHPRHYGNNKWQLDPMHYLDLLRQRPKAFADARPMRQWRTAWPPYLERLLERFCESQGENHGIKDFIGVLMLLREHGEKDVFEAVEAAVRAGVSSREAVEHLLLRAGHGKHDSRPAPLGAWPTFPPPDVSARMENGCKRRIRDARFPLLKPIETFQFESAPELDVRQIRGFLGGRYIREARNVIFLGRSGTGKTHLATALGMEACRQGVRTRFVTGCALANELIEARDEKVLGRVIKRYASYGLLIVDELGYVPLSREGAELLFQVLAERHEKKSVIITTNLGFGDWTQIFVDPTLTAALLDRVTHKAHVIHCSWESYRLKDTLKKK